MKCARIGVPHAQISYPNKQQQQLANEQHQTNLENTITINTFTAHPINDEDDEYAIAQFYVHYMCSEDNRYQFCFRNSAGQSTVVAEAEEDARYIYLPFELSQTRWSDNFGTKVHGERIVFGCMTIMRTTIVMKTMPVAAAVTVATTTEPITTTTT